MRNEIIGLTLAAALLGGLYYAATHRAQRAPAPAAAVAAKKDAALQAAARSVTAGFVGIQRIGAWTLACSAEPVVVKDKPAAAGDRSPTDASAKTGKVSLGRCRALIEFRRKSEPQKAALMLAFRLVGKAPGRLGLFVRMPSGKKGDSVGLRLDKGGFKLSIAGCGKGGCMAVGLLGAAGEAALNGSARAQLILPPAENGKRRAATVPLKGLVPALAAMRRAES